MNSAAWLVFSSSRYDHITPLLHKLHWLRAPERIEFKLAVRVYKTVCMGQHRRIWPMSRFQGPETPSICFLPHCRWMSVAHGCPPSVVRPFLLLLPVLGTVCPNMSRPHPLCLFSEVALRLSSSGVPSTGTTEITVKVMTFIATFVVPAQWQLPMSISVNSFLLAYLPCLCVCQVLILCENYANWCFVCWCSGRSQLKRSWSVCWTKSWFSSGLFTVWQTDNIWHFCLLY